MSGLLLILTGPSGSGKDTVMARLRDELGMTRLITYTSRPMRRYEKQGFDYHFVKKSEFEGMLERKELLEHVLYGLHYKGTHKDSIKAVLKGEKVIWIIEMSRAAGAKELFYETFKKKDADLIWKKTIVVMLGVPDWKVLETRMKRRDGAFNRKDFEKRLKQDKKVLRNHTFENIIHNLEDKLEDTIESIKTLID